VNGRIVWTSACDPSNATSITGIPRNDGEGLLCYILRVLTIYNPTTYAQTNGNGTQVITATNFTNSVWTGGTITNPSGLDKFDVGLNNVDNTSDATKPTSGPQQTYIAAAITAALTGFVPLSVQSLAGGATFDIPYQAAPSVTAFLPIGAAGLVLTSNGSGIAPSWQTSANVNTNANNIVGGPGTNRVLIQLSPGVTGFLGSPTTDAVLKGNGPGTPPSWSAKAPKAVDADNAALAASVAGGLTGDLLYQSAVGVTSFLAVGTANQVLGGGSIPGWQNVDTAATNDTIVKRTATGAVNATGFVGATFSGTSATASALTAVPGLTAGTYGSVTGYPIVTINNGGQITGVTVQNAPAQPTVLKFPEVKGLVGWGIDGRTAFLDSAYRIRVAGDNTVGRMGVGDAVSFTNAPGFMIAPLIEPLSGERPEKVYLTPRNTYVLTNLGNIYSCGSNDAGQLGHSGTATVNRLTRITTLTNIVDFATNSDQTTSYNNTTFCLAARSDGTLWGWGYNGYGQLGNNSVTNVTTGPVQITANGMGARFVSQVYAAGFPCFSMVITNTKELYAAGYNAYGNLGINSTTQSNTFVRCLDDSSNGMLADFAVITGGWDANSGSLLESTSYAVLAGQVYSVGGNTAGQLGQGNTANRQSFKLITGLSGVSQLTISNAALNNNGNSVAAITSSGQLWVWGNNSGGQLAIGTTANQLTPTLASGLSGVTALKALFSGAQNAAAVPNGNVRLHVLTSDGRIRSAGIGTGQTNAGRGYGNGLDQPNTTAFVLAQQNGITYDDFWISGSPTVETVMCRGTDGNLYTWGYNANFQAGIPTGTFFTTPQRANFY
jgi:alpha-tubulin suppressor-like RCC1 family protein